MTGCSWKGRTSAPLLIMQQAAQLIHYENGHTCQSYQQQSYYNQGLASDWPQPAGPLLIGVHRNQLVLIVIHTQGNAISTYCT